jgi:hypothetical protein
VARRLAKVKNASGVSSSCHSRLMVGFGVPMKECTIGDNMCFFYGCFQAQFSLLATLLLS